MRKQLGYVGGVRLKFGDEVIIINGDGTRSKTRVASRWESDETILVGGENPSGVTIRAIVGYEPSLEKGHKSPPFPWKEVYAEHRDGRRGLLFHTMLGGDHVCHFVNRPPEVRPAPAQLLVQLYDGTMEWWIGDDVRIPV